MEEAQGLDFEKFGQAFGWESFFPSSGIGHSWPGNLDS